MQTAMNKVIEVNDANFETEVLRASGLVLVDFYAPWCGPCKMLAPSLDQLAAHYAGRVKFVKVNVDESPRLAMRYEISGVPTVMLFRGGLILDTFVGLPHPRTLRARLDELAPAPAGAAVPA
ncbi:MAG: thioredoxin [Verrucomicrobiales bacterium]|nr:thioredoxin [Verrucomicrobiales bacterium]